MLIVGERINATRKGIREAIRARDAAVVAREAAAQAAAGAHLLDINGGTEPAEEGRNVEWLLREASGVGLPLCLDSSNPDVIRDAARLAAELRGGVPDDPAPGGVPWLMVNSITAEEARFAGLLPIILKYRCALVALCMDDAGVPESAARRVDIGARLFARLKDAGVPESSVYLDQLILPVSVNARHAADVLEVIRELRGRFPGAHMICGLSNISYGLPARPLLNRTFLALAAEAGLDAAILDPTDARLMAARRAALALAGRDAFCADYIAAFRKHQLDA